MNASSTGGVHSSVINAHCPLKALREFMSRFQIHPEDRAIYLIWSQKESKSETLLFLFELEFFKIVLVDFLRQYEERGIMIQM